MNSIDGRKVATDIRKEIIQKIGSQHILPGLAVILVGDDEGSKTYVKLKKAAAEQLGFEFSVYKFENAVAKEDIEKTIDWLNEDQQIDGIIIQLPLPKHLDEDTLINRLSPKKDADGFHKENIKQYLSSSIFSTPGLVEGVIRLIAETGESFENKKAVILANSDVFSIPMKKALERKRAQATIVLTPEKKDLSELHDADIVIVALGKKHFITKKDVKNDAIIIDVGYNREKGKVYGDVDPEGFADTDVFLTPVPGGVGPVTVAMLLLKVIDLYFEHHEGR